MTLSTESTFWNGPDRALPHLFPGRARFTVAPADYDEDLTAGLFFSDDDAEEYGHREWPGLKLDVREVVFPDPTSAAERVNDAAVLPEGRPVVYAGPTLDAKLADAPPGTVQFGNYVPGESLTPDTRAAILDALDRGALDPHDTLSSTEVEHLRRVLGSPEKP